MRQEEHNLQVACVRTFRYKYPDVLIYAIPNGGHRSIKTASALKAEGVVSGVPDLFIAVARGEYHGCYVEMKNGKKGKLSENQKERMTQLTKAGYLCLVCHDFDEFERDTDKYMSL